MFSFFLNSVSGQKIASWVSEKIALNVSYENQVALNQDAFNFNGYRGDIGIKVTPDFSIKYGSIAE